MKLIFVFLLMTVLVVGEAEAMPAWVRKALKILCKLIGEMLKRKRDDTGLSDVTSNVDELTELIGEREARAAIDDITKMAKDPAALEEYKQYLYENGGKC